MKKIAILFLVVAILCPIVLTGCHGAEDRAEFSVPEEFDTTKNYELTFWAKNDTNITQKNIYLKTIEDFEKLYPNIKINVKFYEKYDVMYQDVITNIGTNTTPNVCIAYPDNVATYLTGNNVIVPLEELIKDSKYGLGGSEIRFDGPTTEEIIPKYLEEGKIGDTLYLVPFMRSSEACYINKDMVEALGYEVPDILTWDFIWEVSEKAMEKDENNLFKINGQKTLIPFIYKSTDNMMIQSLKQLNAPYSTPTGQVEIFNDTTRWILDEVAKHADSRAFSTFAKDGYPGNYFNAGRCIFAVDSTAGATWMGSHAPLLEIHSSQVADFETVVRPVPQYDPENPAMISQGPSICIFNKEDPQIVLASWIFMQYLLTNDVQVSYSKTEGYVPVTTKAVNSPEYKDYMSRSGEDYNEHYYVKLDAAKIVIDNVENSFVTNVFNGSASLREAAGELIEMVNKEVRYGVTIDDDYYPEMYSKVSALKHLDEIGKFDGKAELGPLPKDSIIMLAVIGAAWVVMGTIVLVKLIRKKKDNLDI